MKAQVDDLNDDDGEDEISAMQIVKKKHVTKLLSSVCVFKDGFLEIERQLSSEVLEVNVDDSEAVSRPSTAISQCSNLSNEDTGVYLLGQDDPEDDSVIELTDTPVKKDAPEKSLHTPSKSKLRGPKCAQKAKGIYSDDTSDVKDDIRDGPEKIKQKESTDDSKDHLKPREKYVKEKGETSLCSDAKQSSKDPHSTSTGEDDNRTQMEQSFSDMDEEHTELEIITGCLGPQPKIGSIVLDKTVDCREVLGDVMETSSSDSLDQPKQLVDFLNSQEDVREAEEAFERELEKTRDNTKSLDESDTDQAPLITEDQEQLVLEFLHDEEAKTKVVVGDSDDSDDSLPLILKFEPGAKKIKRKHAVDEGNKDENTNTRHKSEAGKDEEVHDKDKSAEIIKKETAVDISVSNSDSEMKNVKDFEEESKDNDVISVGSELSDVDLQQKANRNSRRKIKDDQNSSPKKGSKDKCSPRKERGEKEKSQKKLDEEIEETSKHRKKGKDSKNLSPEKTVTEKDKHGKSKDKVKKHNQELLSDSEDESKQGKEKHKSGSKDKRNRHQQDLSSESEHESKQTKEKRHNKIFGTKYVQHCSESDKERLPSKRNDKEKSQKKSDNENKETKERKNRSPEKRATEKDKHSSKYKHKSKQHNIELSSESEIESDKKTRGDIHNRKDDTQDRQLCSDSETDKLLEEKGTSSKRKNDDSNHSDLSSTEDDQAKSKTGKHVNKLKKDIKERKMKKDEETETIEIDINKRKVKLSKEEAAQRAALLADSSDDDWERPMIHSREAKKKGEEKRRKEVKKVSDDSDNSLKHKSKKTARHDDDRKRSRKILLVSTSSDSDEPVLKKSKSRDGTKRSVHDNTSTKHKKDIDDKAKTSKSSSKLDREIALLAKTPKLMIKLKKVDVKEVKTNKPDAGVDSVDVAHEVRDNCSISADNEDKNQECEADKDIRRTLLEDDPSSDNSHSTSTDKNDTIDTSTDPKKVRKALLGVFASDTETNDLSTPESTQKTKTKVSKTKKSKKELEDMLSLSDDDNDDDEKRKKAKDDLKLFDHLVTDDTLDSPSLNAEESTKLSALSKGQLDCIEDIKARNDLLQDDSSGSESGSESEPDSSIKGHKPSLKTLTEDQKMSDDSDFEEPDAVKRKKFSDRLLNMPLTDSDSEVVPGKKKKTKDKDYSESDGTEDDSDDSIGKKKKKVVKRKRSSTNESSDSSYEKNNKKKRKNRSRIKKVANSSDSDGSNDKSNDDDLDTPRKQRKNIRRIIKNTDLSQQAQDAAKAEEDRRQRIKERQELYNKFEKHVGTEEAHNRKTTRLVLEVNPEDPDKALIEVNKTLILELKPHQVDAVKFLWDCCIENVKRLKSDPGTGCILAHSMGLGKTLSVITFIHTIMSNFQLTSIRTCLIVCPLNTVLNWKNEWGKWFDESEQFSLWELTMVKDNPTRVDMLKDWQDDGGILIIGYEMYRNLTLHKNIKKAKLKQAITRALVDPGPDVVVCDEGHMLKNSMTSLSKALNQIKTKRRVVLTGTPLQNNLVEYHCMVDFVKPSLLGTKKEFCNRFVNPITNGQSKDATAFDVKLMKKRAHILHSTLEGCVQRRDYTVLCKFLGNKYEYVITIRLSDVQIKLYEKYLSYVGRDEGEDGSKVRSVRLFSDYQNLMRVWNHPYLLKLGAIRDEKKEKEKEDSDFVTDGSESDMSSFIDDDDDDKSVSSNKSSISKDVKKVVKTRKSRRLNSNVSEDSSDIAEVEQGENAGSNTWWSEFISKDNQFDVGLSGKITLLAEILRMSEAIGDKVLVFSQSLLSLDCIEDFLRHWDEDPDNQVAGTMGWTKDIDYFRMDGSTSAQNRKALSDIFNDLENHRARLFLISTRAGSLGTNLVGANRVIIFDVSWNPSHDTQSMFRVYRFGQTKPVYVYRFVSQGTMEEKIYERQVTKQSLSQRVVDEHQIERHFTNADLQELYCCKPDRYDPDAEREIPVMPKDRLLADLLMEKPRWIYRYHEHDSLLEQQVGEDLTEDDRKIAWQEYEDEKKGLRQPPTRMANAPQPNVMAWQQQLLKMQQQQQQLYPNHFYNIASASSYLSPDGVDRLSDGHLQAVRQTLQEKYPNATDLQIEDSVLRYKDREVKARQERFLHHYRILLQKQQLSQQMQQIQQQPQPSNSSGSGQAINLSSILSSMLTEKK